MMGSGSTAGEVVGVLYDMDCPHLRWTPERHHSTSYADLWAGAVDDGVLELPPSVEREWVMLDGHTYVVEVREGDSYRTSVIAHTEPEVEADRQVQAVARRLSSLMSVYPYWTEEREGEG